jgi:AAA15 family ATPase/GTPase
MLIQFTISNFLSFKEQNTLSMIASSLKEKKVNSEEIVFESAQSNLMLLKSGVIYGANASGKTNFIKAIDFFKWFVVNSSKGVQANEKVNVQNFKFSALTENAPSYLEAIFLCGEFQYRYGFEMDANRIYSEWLYQKAGKKRAKEVELFYREEQNFEIHTKFSVGKELLNKKMIRENALLLSVAAQFNEPYSVGIMEWLENTTVLIASHDDRMLEEAFGLLDDKSMKERIVKFSQYADLGIEEIEKVENTVISFHSKFDESDNETGRVALKFLSNESEGTIKYFSLAGPIIEALDKGKRLVIDELDAKLHPTLTQKVIDLFNSNETNPKNAQLLFSTHDTNLLNAGLFRRDQVWFTQKDRLGSSELYSLAEYKVRNDASFEKDYLQGKYGGIPIIQNFARLFTSNAE